MLPLRVAPALSLILLAFLATAAAGQDKGSISGKVIDKRTGHAIPFATVTVVGAGRGGLTDSEGQYLVSGVPADTFEVKVQFLGYAPLSKPGVVFAAGKTIVANFEMSEIVVREEKVFEVNAERRLVEVKQGTTIRSVNANEIRNLPVQTIGDVLQQQAGVNTDADQIHIRGGRSDETIFVVNGVTNRDLVTGSSTAGQLNARSVAEVNVATGAYDVRYGNALSGVVEITLKEGGHAFGGGLTTSAGSYGGRSLQLVVGGPDRVVGGLAHALRSSTSRGACSRRASATSTAATPTSSPPPSRRCSTPLRTAAFAPDTRTRSSASGSPTGTSSRRPRTTAGACATA